MARTTQGRHRVGTPGLVWCREHARVDAALAAPAIARRGLVERLLAMPRHLRRAPRPGLASA